MTTTPDPVSEVMALADKFAFVARLSSTSAAKPQRAALESRVRELERDAARYRWLRDEGDSTWAPFAKRAGCSGQMIDQVLDAAIDSARGTGEVK
jgi:hypothetical protein